MEHVELLRSSDGFTDLYDVSGRGRLQLGHCHCHCHYQLSSHQSLNLDWELTNHHSRAPCNTGKNRFINISPCEWAGLVARATVMTVHTLFPWQQMTTAELSWTAPMMTPAVTTSTPPSWMWATQHAPHAIPHHPSLPSQTSQPLTPHYLHKPPSLSHLTMPYYLTPHYLTPHYLTPQYLTPHYLTPHTSLTHPSGLQEEQGLHCLPRTYGVFHWRLLENGLAVQRAHHRHGYQT